METNLNSSQSFGMAMRLGEGGALRIAKAFSDNIENAQEFVKEVHSLPDVDMFVSKDKIEITPLKFTDKLKDFLEVIKSRILFSSPCCTVYSPYINFEAEELGKYRNIAKILQNEINERLPQTDKVNRLAKIIENLLKG